MKSVGEKLRRERLQRGLDLATVSNLTRISPKFLEAIENGSINELPGGFFYRSFVRQYATLLNLNTDEIEAEFDQPKDVEAPALIAALNHTQQPIRSLDPIVADGNRRASGRMWTYVAMLGAVLLGCSAFYTWWHRVENASTSRAASAVTAPAVEPVRNPPVAVPHTEQVTSPPQPGANLTPPPAPVAATVSPDDHVVVTITASAVTWIGVSTDGKPAWSGLLRPDETRTLGARERTSIRLGNAGGVLMKWNGKTVGPVGPAGQIRTVIFTPESYKVIAPDESL